MAGILTRTHSPLRHPSLSSSLFRHRSTKSGSKFAHLIELDLDSATSSSSSDISGGVRKLEDVIHSIIVRRSAPDWLPFLPGSSYWVPPRRRPGPGGIVDLIGNLAAHPRMRPTEETLSLSSVRGWPSSAYYFQGSASARPLPMDVQVVEVKFQESSDNESQSEDEEH